MGPEVAIEITTGTGDGRKFVVGTVLGGTFLARDRHFGSFDLGVEPAVNPPPADVPVPDSGIVETALAPGNAWSLATAGMHLPNDLPAAFPGEAAGRRP